VVTVLWAFSLEAYVHLVSGSPGRQSPRLRLSETLGNFIFLYFFFFDLRIIGFLEFFATCLGL
jgi:hypothetical protein